MDNSPNLHLQIKRLQKISLLVGLTGLILSTAVLGHDKQLFLGSYLVSFLFFLGITVGVLPLLCLHHLTGGNWGYPIRRIAEIISRLTPLFILLFLPIAFHLPDLYLWAKPGIAEHHELIAKKQMYLNIPFFMIRAVIYFAIWSLLGYVLYRWSRNYDETHDRAIRSHLQTVSGFGLVLFGLTATFSAVDWVMSLEPEWYSSIYGFLFMTGETLSGFSFAIFLALIFVKEKPFSEILTPSRSHDLGNLLFAFIMLWAYVSLTQFIIVWSGNLLEEIPWYLKRFQGGWGNVVSFTVAFHFVLPFLLLLLRRTKQSFRALASVALLILVMRWVDLMWLVKPELERNFSLHWVDLTLFCGIGGIWFTLLCQGLKKVPLFLNHDPLLTKK